MNKNITYFAKTNYRGSYTPFGIKREDRRLHTYLVGKTGSGKSSLLKNFIVQDLQNGEGVCVLDPHGQLIDEILDYIPRYRTREVVYFNPADQNRPIGFNILESVEPQHQPLVASQVVSVFRNIWEDSWGPRLEYILYNSVASLLEVEGSTLLGIPKILIEKEYRHKVVSQLRNPMLRKYWLDEYEKYDPRFQKEAISPILNKVGQFLIDPVIRNVVGQPENKIDFNFMMDNKRILLCNLSKGQIGEDKTNLLGSFIITKLFLSAIKRATIPEEKRQDHYVYVDECQNLATDIFASILSEARKYRMNLTLSHQYLEQLKPEIKSSIFGNVGTLIAFRLGAEDALELEKEFRAKFTATDLEGLGRYQVYLKLAIDGATSQPFSAVTMHPNEITRNFESNKENIIKTSRQRYGRNKDLIEGWTNEFLNN